MCLYPQTAQLSSLGRIEFSTEGNLRIPCGKCTECVSKRALEWATRARHEISCHLDNCFLTLTYDNNSLPSIFVVKSEFQKFIKRLRKKTKTNLRYMVSHEYGSHTFRPHHHCIIFGYNPSSQTFLRNTPSGQKIFTSTEIENLWTHGFHSIGTANERTAYYIASYSLKGKKHMLTDPKTGELVEVSDCMDASKRPAIGYNYFVKNFQQLIDSGAILPRYYFKKLEQLNPTLYERYENERMFKFKARSSHEIYAKFVIDQQKISDSEFRELDETTATASAYLKNALLTKRDDYHHHITKEKL